jgi:subtilase family serine protease
MEDHHMRTIKYSAALTIALLVTPFLPAQTLLKPALPAKPSQIVKFNIYLPLQHKDQLNQLVAQLHAPGSAASHHWLTDQEFKQRFGPDPAGIARIKTELASYGIKVNAVHSHGLQVEGTVASIQNAFKVKLSNGSGGATGVIAEQSLRMPPSLVKANAHVLAFSPVVRHHTHSQKKPLPLNRYSNVGPYWFTDLRQAYNFPSVQSLDGKGETIAILMSNDFLDSDVATYFAHEKAHTPTILHIPVDGGAPFDPDASSEVSLDVQQSSGLAPGARILDYNIPDLSDASVLDGLLQIVSDNYADIVSMSFGGAEGFYTAAYNSGVDYTYILQIYDELFLQGNAQGITFITSSGDNGALDLPSLSYFDTPQNPPVVTAEYLVGIEEPADSPHVTAVGGTNLLTAVKSGAAVRDSSYISENADGDLIQPEDPYGVGNLVEGGIFGSGGGISAVFAKPSYQYLVNTGSNMRTIPDISMQMGGCPFGTINPCPEERSGVVTAIGGQYFVLIGTSASAPEFAAVLAITEQRMGGARLGNVNYYIYSLAAGQQFGWDKAFHQGIPGNNGFYISQQGVSGYNLITGNGTVSVRDFISAPNLPAAGLPQTPSNP